ncbi:hypothetical protein [Streptomyces echinatus]|uniref:hypothetical protein n=1 Tax=Streptomyces echinatus TaxID=67293 RepID=UPI00379B013A
MASDGHDQAGRSHPQAPWWWGIGPVGAFLLVVAGAAWELWVFFGRSASADTPAPLAYQASKAIAIGLVLLGGTLLQRLRGRASATDRANGQDHG